MTLSDLTVRQAKAAKKNYSIPDSDGLGLVTGGKSWHLRYCWLGKQKHISLGNYLEISLREARTLREEVRALLAKGINPDTNRKQKRHAVNLAADYTFNAVCDAWGEHRRKEIKEGRNSTLSQILRIFNKDVLPSRKQMSIYDIRRPQLLWVLAITEERRVFTTAEKVRTWLGQLFRYALVIVEGMEANPASDLDVVAEPKPTTLPASPGASRAPAEAQALQPAWLAGPARHPAAVLDWRAHRRAAAGAPVWWPLPSS